ncbi:MAG: monofunctional biosynthetic peptidoglycan transglycosylase [Pseudomonadales bacterium]
MRVQPSDRIGGMIQPKRGRRAPRRRSRRRGSALWKRLLQLSLSFALVSLLAVLPLRWLNPPTTAFMLQDSQYHSSAAANWQGWNQLGKAMPLAVVAAEDQNFALHNGFDFEAIQEAIKRNQQGERLRGASTLSQQLAKNLYLWPGKNMVRKGLEAYLTGLIEFTWPKRRILEVYLNVAEFGPGVYGVGQASKRYFNKAPNDLNLNEAALLAAVLPNPKRLSVAAPGNYVQGRSEWIEEQVQRLQREQWLAQL